MRASVVALAMFVGAPAWAAPSLSAGFASPIGPGNTSVLTFTVAVTGPSSDVAFTATLPAGVVFTTPDGLDTTCDASVSVLGATLTFAEGRIASTCTVTAWVASDTPGTHTLVTGPLTSSAGSFGGASADLVVDATLPQVRIEADPPTVPLGEPTRLTYTVTAGTTHELGAVWAHPFPSGLVLATPDEATTDCGSLTVSSTHADLLVSFLAPGASCSASVWVQPTSGGVVAVHPMPYARSGTPVGSSVASIRAVVDNVRVVVEDDPVPAGGTATLGFHLRNFDRFDAATGIALTLDLGSVLSGLVAVGLPSDPCGTGSTLTGTSLLSLTGGSLPAGGACDFDVTVQVPSAAPSGDHVGSTGAAQATVGGAPVTWNAASVSLRVREQLVAAVDVIDDPITSGESFTLAWTFTNASATAVATEGTFVMDIDALAPGATPVSLPSAGACGAGSVFTRLAATQNAPERFQATGLTLAAGAACTFEALYATPADAHGGVTRGSTGPITARMDGTLVSMRAAETTLTILAAPRLSLSFDPSRSLAGDVIDVTFELSSGDNGVAEATGVTFSVDLDAALVGLAAVGLPLSDVCGAGSLVSGTGEVTLSGGTVASEGACAFTVSVQVPGSAASGTYRVTTSEVTATVAGRTVRSSAPGVDLTIGGAVLTVTTTPSRVAPGVATSVNATYTLVNHDASVGATGISMSDAVAGIAPGTTAAVTTIPDPCGAGSTLQVLSGNVVSLTGGSLGAGAQCAFTATWFLPALAAGEYAHGPATFVADHGGGSTAQPVVPARFVVDDPLGWTATGGSGFSGDAVRVTIAIADLAGSGATDLAFTLDLDAALSGLAASGLPISDACGAGSLLTGTSVVAFTGGTLASGQSCTLAFDVVLPVEAAGPSAFDATTSDLTADGLAVSGPRTLSFAVREACREGFTPVGGVCVDRDECALELDDCDVNATCTNTIAGFTCACDAGWSGDGRQCADVDECAAASDDCPAIATCTNTDGGFTCACPAGTAGAACDPTCGDGLVVAGEGCDDGALSDDDGCDAACAIEAGWTCDGAPSACAPTCGDGLVRGDERCDDGALAPGDGCDATCAVEAGWACTGEPSVCDDTCGDGVQDPLEECDDGRDNGPDGPCDTDCTLVDPADTGDTGAEGRACGCATTPGAWPAWLPLLLLVVRRRRAA